MSRDPKKLEVFQMADDLVVEVYRATRSMPAEERFGLQMQLRRAAVSVPTNIVEGSARHSSREYANFLNIALGSATEVRYLLGLSQRLDLLKKPDAEALVAKYDRLVRALSALVTHFMPIAKSRGEARP